jgi:glycerol kinase
MNYFLALDQGTTSSRAIVFDDQMRPVAQAQQEFAQYFPQSGWVEHDAMEIWHSQLEVLRQAVSKAGLRAQHISAIGITNQRETTVLWDRKTGEPISRAIVWQDRRAEPWCVEQREAGVAEYVRQRTGLVLDAYFSVSKILWMLDNVPTARARAERGELAFGTIDSWLLWNLTGGAVHATDPSNASRTMLFNLEQGQWDDVLVSRWHVPKSLLPSVQPSASRFGETLAEILGEPIPICGVAGDQQSALFGQACFKAGQAKNTYGTGCFMLMHTGEKSLMSKHGLLSTATCTVGGATKLVQGKALEGSVFIGGAVVQWLRDGLGLIASAEESETLAASVPNSGDVILVPAFVGLGSPYWNANARGSISGLTRGTTKAHLARAALDSIALQSTELLEAMREDSGFSVDALAVDGGAATNNLLMQTQADLIGIPVLRPHVLETTARGAAMLAALGSQTFDGDIDDLSKLVRSDSQIERVFHPLISRDEARARMARWKKAVQRSLDWV